MSTASELFDRYHLEVFRYLLAATRERSAAEDLTQETFLRVLRGAKRYRDEGKEAAWIFTIARNLARSRRKRVREFPSEIPERAGDPTGPLKVELARALGRLESPDREVFLLRECGGLGYREIAEICSLTPDAVRSRIHRTRRTLRESLQGDLTTVRRRAVAEEEHDAC